VRLVTFVVALMSGVILLQAVLDNFPLIRIVQISAVLSGQVPYGLFFLIALAYAVGAAGIAKRGALVLDPAHDLARQAVRPLVDRRGLLIVAPDWQPVR